MEAYWGTQLATLVFWYFLSASTGMLRVAAPGGLVSGLCLKQDKRRASATGTRLSTLFGKFKAGRNLVGIFPQPACLPFACLPFPSLRKGGMVAARNSGKPLISRGHQVFTIRFSASFLLAECAEQPQQPTPTLTVVVAVAGVGNHPPAATL